MKITLLRAALTAAALSVLPASALAQVNEQPPIGEPRPFELPETRSFTMENGLDVTFIQFGLAPTTRISLQVRAGNIDDGDQTWLVDLTGAMMEEGAGGRSAAEMATAIASMGGEIGIGVGRHATSINANVLSNYATDALDLLADVARSPNFDASEFDRVRQNMVRDVDVQRAQAGSIASEAYSSLLFGNDHPYGNSLPSEEQLRSYSMDDVLAFYEANFSAARTRIYVAGRFDESAMETAIREAFGDWEAGDDSMPAGIAANSGPVVQFIDRPGAPQTTLRLGFPVGGREHADASALTVMNAMLGGSFTSRLTRNLREDKGWTYSPGSGVSYTMAGGYWTFNADVTAENTADALRETFGEIRRMQNEVPGREEADGMRTWLSGIFILQNASTSGVISQLATRDLFGLPEDYLQAYVPGLLAVSDEDISRVASDFLPLDQMTLVLVGDLDTIRDDVMALPELDGVRVIMPDAE